MPTIFVIIVQSHKVQDFGMSMQSLAPFIMTTPTLFNYIFIYLKNHKGSIIVWIVIIFLEYFSLIAKFTCSKLDRNQKYFCMFKAFKPQEWTILIFFKCFFSTKCAHHSFWKLERILTLMIKRAKGLEQMKIVFITHLNKFGSKTCAFDLENYGFWKCGFNKSCSYIHVIEGMNA